MAKPYFCAGVLLLVPCAGHARPVDHYSACPMGSHSIHKYLAFNASSHMQLTSRRYYPFYYPMCWARCPKARQVWSKFRLEFSNIAVASQLGSISKVLRFHYSGTQSVTHYPTLPHYISHGKIKSMSVAVGIHSTWFF